MVLWSSLCGQIVPPMTSLFSAQNISQMGSILVHDSNSIFSHDFFIYSITTSHLLHWSFPLVVWSPFLYLMMVCSMSKKFFFFFFCIVGRYITYDYGKFSAADLCRVYRHSVIVLPLYAIKMYLLNIIHVCSTCVSCFMGSLHEMIG